ncbi:MAG: hypothetical protein EOP09_01215, partial [Proteobacteria bacterium]
YVDYLKSSEVTSAQEIEPGSGAIIKAMGIPVAVSKSESGKLKACAGICPHLGAVMRWNEAEKSWDCPAHGSRFTAEGKILCGPAHSNLREVSVP